MRKFIFLSACLLFGTMLKADDFVKIKVNDFITVSLPEDFITLPQSEINRRQISARKPLLFYTDPHSEVNFTVNMSYSLWGKNDLEILKSFYRASIMNLYDEVLFIKDDIVEIGERKFARFEFESIVRDDEGAIVLQGDVEKYTLIIYTILDNNNTVLISFTCPALRKETWQQTAHEIMKRVEIE